MTRKGWLLFIAMSVIWGIPYLFIKIALRELDPAVVVFARVGIAALVLLPIAARRGAFRPGATSFRVSEGDPRVPAPPYSTGVSEGDPRAEQAPPPPIHSTPAPTAISPVRTESLRPLRGRWLMVAALALVQIVGPFLLISYGEQHIASSLTSLLIAADPLLVVLFALRFDASERVNGLRLIGLLVGMIGVVTLLGLDVGGDAQRLLGAIFVLLAAAGYAASTLLIKRPAIATLPTLGVVTVECITATMVLLPLALTRLPNKLPGMGVIASLLVLGLVCTALAYLIFYALVAEVGAGRAAVITYVNPAVSVFLGVTLLAEPLNAAIIVGFLLILLGSWLSTGGVLPPVTRFLRTRQQPQIDRSTAISGEEPARKA